MSGHENEEEILLLLLLSTIKKWYKWSQIVLAMLMIQVISTGMQLLSRVILKDGTFVFALVSYRNIVGAICVAPLAFYFERGQEKKFGWSVWLWLFLNALTGIILSMGLFYYGVQDTTATYATNFLNLIPIVTFIFSILARIEGLNLGTRAGKLKTLGALLSVGGAITTSLYKGQAFHIGHHHLDAATAKSSGQHWTRGTLFLVGGCLSYATWFIVQAKLQKVFPFKYWATLLTCAIGSVQSVIIGLCLNRSKAAWKLGWNLELLTIVYSGSLATAVVFSLLLWAVSKQGPTYPSMFNPLTLIFVAIFEAFLLGEPIHVGMLIGMVLIISGLYSFLWGKGKEDRGREEAEGSRRSNGGGSQLSAIVVPSSSPLRDHYRFVTNNNINVDHYSLHKKTQTFPSS